MAYDLVDWKQAPTLARWWAIDANGKAYWHCQPDVAAFTDFWMAEQIEAPHFGYTGDYKESLTERPRPAGS
ncbi:hypothetical protein ACSBPU_13085 [Parapusillimonas sp. JC17]|uniref:hypothetical protein n=1 Tax=Parapusillimonas sp. JC17 TaxID=3445768 RepID=UPI003FA0239C